MRPARQNNLSRQSSTNISRIRKRRKKICFQEILSTLFSRDILMTKKLEESMKRINVEMLTTAHRVQQTPLMKI